MLLIHIEISALDLIFIYSMRHHGHRQTAKYGGHEWTKIERTCADYIKYSGQVGPMIMILASCKLGPYPLYLDNPQPSTSGRTYTKSHSTS